MVSDGIIRAAPSKDLFDVPAEVGYRFIITDGYTVAKIGPKPSQINTAKLAEMEIVFWE